MIKKKEKNRDNEREIDRKKKIIIRKLFLSLLSNKGKQPLLMTNLSD